MPNALQLSGVAALVASSAVALRRAGAGRGRMARALAAVPVVILLAACVGDNRPEGCDEPVAALELTLSADALDPSDPAACRDQEVTMTVTPEVDGVLHIHGYDEWVPATSVTAGEEIELSFTAERAGQFPIEFHPEDDPRGEEVGVFTVHEP